MSSLGNIRADMQTAMKSADRDKVRTLRTLMAKLKEKEIEKKGALSEEDAIKVLQNAVKQRKESIEMFQKGNRTDLVESEARELAIIESYLPAQIPEEKLSEIIQKVIQDTGASSLRDIGKVMPVVMREVAGRADGRKIQELVKQKLGG